MSKASPIIPLVTNLLGFGIPAIAEAVERGRARRAARKGNELDAETVAANAKQAGARAALAVGNTLTVGGASIGVADQIGLGAELIGAVTATPTEFLPAHAPEWVQWSYLAVTVLGVVVRFLAAKYPKPVTA